MIYYNNCWFISNWMKIIWFLPDFSSIVSDYLQGIEIVWLWNYCTWAIICDYHWNICTKDRLVQNGKCPKKLVELEWCMLIWSLFQFIFLFQFFFFMMLNFLKRHSQNWFKYFKVKISMNVWSYSMHRLEKST